MYEFLSYVTADFMTRNPMTIGPSATLGQAGEIFLVRDFNALPVVAEEHDLLGMLTKLDWLKAFAFTPETIVPHYDEIMRRRVDRYFSRDIVTVSPAEPLTRALQRMIDTRHKSLPVVEKGRLVGIIAREDIVRALNAAGSSTCAAMPERDAR